MNIAWRVYKGMCWLDKHSPNWWKKINLQTLNIRNQETCIVGQLRLFGTIRHLDVGLAGHGFDSRTYVNDKMLSDYEFGMEYWYLNTEWKRQIQLRLDDANQTKELA
tara:strand:+ start:3344 stop:3664 length:321 start_codon:yes stop_codon:yes gene_type:complete